MILPDQNNVEIKNEEIVVPDSEFSPPDGNDHSDDKTTQKLDSDKSFDDHNNLSEHAKSEQEFECDMRDKTFMSSANSTIHLRTHTDERPFESDLCDEAFKQNSHLERHKPIHTGEKPFSCDISPKAFAGHGGLGKHKKSAHKKEVEGDSGDIMMHQHSPENDVIKSERPPIDYEENVNDVPMPIEFLMEPKIENDEVTEDDVDIKLEPGSSR